MAKMKSLDKMFMLSLDFYENNRIWINYSYAYFYDASPEIIKFKV